MFAAIEEAIEEFRIGRMLIVVDDEDRENEGDFIMAAEKVTPETINFITKYGRGMVCLPLTSERCEELQLEMMVGKNSALHGTAFTVTIDAKDGTTTGISAFDRALTIKRAIDPKSKPDDFGRPGHIFPLHSAEGGVLKRAGHTGGMHPRQDRFVARHVALNQSQMMLAGDNVAEVNQTESAEGGGEINFHFPINQLLIAAAVFNEVADGNNFKSKLFGDLLQLGQPRHCAVVIHYFAQDSGGI